MAKGNDIGALWVKQGAKGEYLSGYVMINDQKYPIVCFINGYKKEAKHPDYRILPSEKRGEGGGYPERPPRSYEEQAAPLNERGQAPEKNPDDDLTDVPF